MDSPTPRPQDNIGDCTPQLCNVHCPHQCFLYLSEASPPPPPPPRRHQSTATLSPEIIIITVTAAASFFFLACFLLAFKFCGNHRSPAPSHAPPAAAAAAPSPSTGLDDSLVQQIPSFTHSRVDGPLGDEVDCAVCLHDFADGDRLRRLPKCRHTFHQICVDTWLKSHSSCPICRAAVCEADVLMEERGEAAGEVVVVVDEVEEMEEGGRQH